MTRSTLERQHIRARALRAAAAVALLGGAVACGTAPATELPPPVDAGATAPESTDASAATLDAGLADASEAALDAGLADASEATLDAGVACDREALTPEDYVACCEAIGWVWSQGCEAWGPPAPPQMKELA
jgi:hypothetical protein